MTLHIIPADRGHKTRIPTGGSLDDFDYEAARRDGWTLVDCGYYGDGARRIELRKHERPPFGAPCFREDRDAWLHVATRAHSGSPLHCAALDLIDRRERLAIDAACGLW